MSQEKNENTYTAPNKQVQKSPKEKTMATGHTNSLATIDITQATTLEEQALIIQNNLENTNSPTASLDNFANYYAGKYWENYFEQEMLIDGGKKAASKTEKTNYEIGDAAKDKEFMQKKILRDIKLNGDVGKGKTNNKEDVKWVATKLKYHNIEDIPTTSIEKGEWSDSLTDRIKTFQKNNNFIRLYNKSLAKYPNGIVSHNDPTYKALFDYNSGLVPIYANRTQVDKQLKVTIKDNVGADWGKYKAINTPEDVKLVAILLQENKIDKIPESALKDGECTDEFVERIKDFQKNKEGIVLAKGSTINKLLAVRKVDPLKLMEYDMQTMEHVPGEERDKYEEKLDIIQENMGVKDDSDIAKILQMANKAATDTQYFSELTKDVGEKLIVDELDKKDGAVKLSLVLLDRMTRFHKFLVAAGLYNGNMDVVDGARSPERAHRWSLEWIIETKSVERVLEEKAIKDTIEKKKKERAALVAKAKKEGKPIPKEEELGELEIQVKYPKEKTNLKKYQDEVMKNLIIMSKDDKYIEGDYIIDIDGNKWAKKEHFYEDFESNPDYYTKANKEKAEKVTKTINDKEKNEIKYRKIYHGDVVAYDKKDKEKAEAEANALLYKSKSTQTKVTKIFWGDVVDFVKAYSKDEMKKKENISKKLYRNSSSAPASSGYNVQNDKRLPLGNVPGVTDHKTGEAIDINSNGFLAKTDAIIDLIALRFGVLRDGGSSEYWHFEMTGVQLSKENEKYLKKTE